MHESKGYMIMKIKTGVGANKNIQMSSTIYN